MYKWSHTNYDAYSFMSKYEGASVYRLLKSKEKIMADMEIKDLLSQDESKNNGEDP